ncbi:MAG: AAA family ATPase [Chloroflexota bacterium]|nr:AAA family ATPase [Chloroflexota bacterium]MDE2920747.1 AAA family ATPase [Chloroflexota bacterium]
MDGKIPPLLVIVNGAPGSGKTTLSRRLADALQLPHLERDGLKEILADHLEVADLRQSNALTPAAVGIFYALAAELARARVGMVLDQAYRRGLAEDQLRPLLASCRTVIIHCVVPREVSVKRYMGRFERGARHAAHFDGERIALFRAGKLQVDWSRSDPLELDAPTLLVDTVDGYKPAFEEIVEFVRLNSSG